MKFFKMLWEQIVELATEIGNFFVDMYHAITEFLLKFMGHDAMIILGIMVIAIVAALVLTKIIRR